MKALALAVLAFALAVPGRAAAEGCSGWTLTVLNRRTKELKTWCPSDKEGLVFVMPEWKEVACLVTAVTKSVVETAGQPDLSLHERSVACNHENMSALNTAFWAPSLDAGLSASFSVMNVKTEQLFKVTLSRGSRPLPLTLPLP